MSNSRVMSEELTFKDIEFGLVELVMRREDAVAEYERIRAAELPPTPIEDEALAAIDQCDEAIAAYLKAEVQKVDGVAAYILREEAAAWVVEHEMGRLADRLKMHKARADRVREMALRVMQDTDQRTIEGARHALKVRKNPPAVVIAQPELVPDNMRRFTLTLNPEDFVYLRDLSARALTILVDKSKSEPSKSAIAAALKGGGAVPGCRMQSAERLEVR